MDLLFREYADPFCLLDQVVPVGCFCDFLETFEAKHEEKIRWEFFIHKLSPMDERTWEEFNHDLDHGVTKKQERPPDEDIEKTIRTSYRMMKNFKLEGGEMTDGHI